MPTSKNNRNGQIEAHRRGRLGAKSSSFHGQSSATAAMSSQLRRPKTVPDLVSHRTHGGSPPDGGLPRQPPKLLLHVTVLGSLGPVKVLMTQESKVGDLVAASVRQYQKEGRRPILPTTDPSAFDLHYSQFSLESMDREEKVLELGSRNFLLCPRKAEGGGGEAGSMTPGLGSCSKEAEKVGKENDVPPTQTGRRPHVKLRPTRGGTGSPISHSLEPRRKWNSNPNTWGENGVEVKAGAPVEVDPDEFGKCIHLSQAALGEAKSKASEHVILYLKFDDQKLVLGTLSQEKFPQLSFDLVLEKKFELSHNWKSGSVYFCGYKAELPGEMDDELTDSEDDEDIPVVTKDNAKPDIKPEVAKAAASKSKDVKPADSKKQVKVVDPKKDEAESDDEEDDEDDTSDEDMLGGDVDASDDSESDDDFNETPPKKVDHAKKRPKESALKTPVPAKKAKPATPQKADGKKGGHVDTPYPKKDGKTPKGDQTPKSGGQFTCKSCSKTFNSEGGLQQHSKAKHGVQ